MFDAIEIEKRGVPTVTISHDTFARVAAMHARILGLEDLPLIIEPSPDSGAVGEDIGPFADETFEQLLDGLLARGQREELAGG